MTLEELAARSEEIMDFVRETDKELQALHKLITVEEDTPFVRRTTIRTLFSVIESQVAQLKKHALLERVIPGNFGPEEILFLEDREYVVQNGSIESRRSKVRFIDNYILAFMLFHRSERPDFKLDFGTQEARDFKGSIKIRDRITHPKNSLEWTLGDDDMALVWRGWNWHHEQMIDALKV